MGKGSLELSTVARTFTSNSPRLGRAFGRYIRRYPEVIDETVFELATDSLAFFEKTTTTWSSRPSFTVVKSATARYGVKTNSERWNWIDRGTRRRTIRAKPGGLLLFKVGGRAKSKPGTVRSFKGSRGSKWRAARKVKHPGIRARHWTTTIVKRMQPQAANRLRRALIIARQAEGFR